MVILFWGIACFGFSLGSFETRFEGFDWSARWNLNSAGLSFNDTKLIFLAIFTGDFGFSVICVVFENDFLAADNRSDDIT